MKAKATHLSRAFKLVEFHRQNVVVVGQVAGGSSEADEVTSRQLHPRDVKARLPLPVVVHSRHHWNTNHTDHYAHVLRSRHVQQTRPNAWTMDMNLVRFPHTLIL